MLQRAVGWFARRLKDGAINIEQPAMIAAAYSLRADQAELQRGAAVTAVAFQQPDPAASITEHHEFLAQNLHCERQILELIRIADRLPEPAHVLAARRIRADMRQLRIFGGNLPVIVSAVPCLQKRSPGDRHRKSPVLMLSTCPYVAET